MIDLSSIKQYVNKGSAFRTGITRTMYLGNLRSQRVSTNPLQSLTPQRAVELYNNWRKGIYADLMLTYDALEEFDETLGIILDKRSSALAEMDHAVTIDADLVAGDADLQSLAERQQKYISQKIKKIDNLKKAIDFLALASFRGYSHLEIVETPEKISLVPIDQWLIVRPDKHGPWFYNGDASAYPLRPELMDTSRLIIRDVPRPINIPVMFLIVAKAHAADGWDTFIDIFGNPAIFFEYPPGTSDDRAREYDRIAEGIIGDGRGGFPNGGKVHTVETTARGGDTFQARIDWCDTQIAQRGTGGYLTIQAESGTGTLASNGHQETFRQIAAGEGAGISAVINEQLVYRWLDRKFPGQPHLVSWSLSYDDPKKQDAQIDRATRLSAQGWRASDETISEMAGFEVETVEQPVIPQQPAYPYQQALLTNRSVEPRQTDTAPLTSGELEALRQVATLPPNPSRIADTTLSLKTAIETRLTSPASDEPENETPPVADPLHGPDSGDSDAPVITNSGPYRCWRPHCRGHREPQTTGGQGKGSRQSGKMPDKPATPLKAADNASPQTKKTALEKAITRVWKKGGKVEGAAKLGKRKLDITAGNPATHGVSHIKAKHGSQKGATPEQVAKALAHGTKRKDRRESVHEKGSTRAVTAESGKKSKLITAYKKNKHDKQK